MKTTKNYIYILTNTALAILLTIFLSSCGNDDGDNPPAVSPVTSPETFLGMVSIKTSLNSAEEVPAGTSPGTGIAVFTLKPGSGELIGSVTFSGLTSNAVAAHIHQGAAGTNGGILIGLEGGAGTTSGKWRVPAGTVLSAEQLALLYASGLYVNIHTVGQGAGEIRGQLRFKAVTITTKLSGAEEVPPVSTTATGSSNLNVNFGTGELTGSVSFSGLSSSAEAAHIHQANAGAIGGVIIGLVGGEGSTAGTWNVPDGTIMSGDQLNLLITDGLYVNIHSEDYPDGEIRGQLAYRIQLKPALNGTFEVPPVATPGTGAADLLFNPASGAIGGSVTFMNLTTAATASHIHQGMAGTNGGIVVGLVGGAGGTSGTWSIPAGTVLSADYTNLLLANELYLNIHTTGYGAGEIRGQLIAPQL